MKTRSWRRFEAPSAMTGVLGARDAVEAARADAARADASADARIRVVALGRDIGTCFGGAEKVALELLTRLDRERFERYLCTTHVPAPALESINAEELNELASTGVRILRLERRSARSNAAWRQLYRLLADEQIDVLHAHMPRASVPGALIGRLAKVPVIVSHEHGWSFRGKPLRRFLDRNVVARCSDLLLAVSEWDRRHIIEIEHIDPAGVRVLPNAIAPVSAERSNLHEELGLPADTRLIGAVGRLYPEKGYSDLIRAIAILKRQAPCPFRCIILGSGPEKQQLETLIARLDLTQDVQLIGWRDDVAGVIRAVDVAVLSSRNEGSPLAIIEYMAAAAPIVATSVGGIPELIEDKTHGLLVPPQDAASLAGAIRSLLADPALARRLGVAARDRQLASYDLDAVVRELEGIYIELAAKSRRGRLRTRAGALSANQPGRGDFSATTT